MMRISRILNMAWIAILAFALAPATIAHAQTLPVPEMTSSGLLTFSGRDRAIRVAIVFAKKDDAVVETIVRFVDAKGKVLKVRRGDLSDGAPVIAELTRSDVGNAAEVLVRAEVFHKLPGDRRVKYPILITLQPISEDGTARFLIGWNGGVCGCPTCGPPEPQGQHADCDPTVPEIM